MSVLTGTAVTVTYADGGQTVAVLASTPRETIAGLNTCLGKPEPERPAYLALPAIDAEKVIYANLAYVAEIVVEPQSLLADLTEDP